MLPTDLEFISTNELVSELMRRKTFLGIVVHSQEELKSQWNGERMFQVHHNDNLNKEEVSRLLERVAGHLEGRNY